MGDVRISVRIPKHKEEVWEAFKEYTISKWGKKHSALGLEVANALEYYLQAMGNGQQSNGIDPPENQRCPPPSNNKKGVKVDIPRIKKAILKEVEPGGSLHRDMLGKIIRSVTHVGSSKSVEDRIKTLIADGFLERVWDDDLKGKIFKVKGDTTRDYAC
jgi:hypothetical protein